MWTCGSESEYRPARRNPATGSRSGQIPPRRPRRRARCMPGSVLVPAQSGPEGGDPSHTMDAAETGDPDMKDNPAGCWTCPAPARTTRRWGSSVRASCSARTGRFRGTAKGNAMIVENPTEESGCRLVANTGGGVWLACVFPYVRPAIVFRARPRRSPRAGPGRSVGAYCHVAEGISPVPTRRGSTASIGCALGASNAAISCGGRFGFSGPRPERSRHLARPKAWNYSIGGIDEI